MNRKNLIIIYFPFLHSIIHVCVCVHIKKPLKQYCLQSYIYLFLNSYILKLSYHIWSQYPSSTTSSHDNLMVKTLGNHGSQISMEPDESWCEER